MKDFVNDIQNLIVKHWGKLLLIFILTSLISNFKDVKKGFLDGYNDTRNKVHPKNS